MIKPLQKIPKPTPIIKRILVRCPDTGKLTATGRTVEETAFKSLRLTNRKMSCPHCRQTHNWTKKDVVLAR
jgi:hypothetical protein